MRKQGGAFAKKSGYFAALLASSILVSGISSAAKAQIAPPPDDGEIPETLIPDVRETLDVNAVDLSNGSVQLPIASVSIGSGGDVLQFGRDQQNEQFRDEVNGSIRLGSTAVQTIVSIGGQSEAFSKSGAIFSSVEMNGSTLVQSGNLYTYTRRDGTVAIFDATKGNAQKTGSVISYNYPVLTSLTLPNGSIKTYTYTLSNFIAVSRVRTH